MLDGIEAFFHPVTWVILALLAVGIVLFGFGSTIADRVMGPDPEEVRQECLRVAHVEKESCLNGGVLNGIFKTKARIEKCDEIYQREAKACG